MKLPGYGTQALALALALGISTAPALAEKPEWAGKGKGKGHEGKEDRREHFRDEHRDYVRGYYENEYRGGHCPPGLAEKHNGCMPPGQAKKWRMGRPLPAEVVIYEVPAQLVIKLGPPPSGYRYVRVASDILLIAAGTRMVVDAINDLGRR